MIQAQYTTILSDLLVSGFDIGLDDYPIWDESYRNILNQKIVDRYSFREIGFETPAMFKFYLNRTMNEIMPYYNQLYQTTIYKYNPIHNVDYTIEEERKKSDRGEGENSSQFNGNSTGKNSGTVKDNGSTSSNGVVDDKSVHIDTPQGTVALAGMNVDTENVASDVDLKRNESKLSGTSKNEQEHTSSASNDVRNNAAGSNKFSTDSTETYLKRLAGNYGVKTTQGMIQEERDLIINIDMMIVKELENLFMGLW